MQRFENKIALVTGAASGIGRATALRLAKEGASLACVDIDVEGLAQVSSNLKELEAPHITIECDICNEDQVAQAVAQTVEHFGRLHILCNVAGALHTDHTHELSLEDWNRIIAINLTGTFLMCRAALPHLIEETGSAIVNTSSTAALDSHPWMAAYAASKGGVLALTRSLALEYLKQGLRVNAICPGGVATPMHDQFTVPDGADPKLMSRGRPRVDHATPDVAAAAIAFIASDEASYMQGAELRIDGGAFA